jgi:hypothetical protein
VGVLLVTSFVADELLPMDRAAEDGKHFSETQKSLKEKYKRYVSSQSDLVTIVNIFGEFFATSFPISGNNLLPSLLFKKRIREFAIRESLNGKVLLDALSFALQVLKIGLFIFDQQTFASICGYLNGFQKVDSATEKRVVDIIVQSSADKCAKKRIVFTQTGLPKALFETLDFQRGRLFVSSFVDKKAEFYVYKNIFRAGE